MSTKLVSKKSIPEASGKSKVQEALASAKVKKAKEGTKVEVVKKRPPLSVPKKMTQQQEFRKDSTEHRNTPIMKTTSAARQKQDDEDADYEVRTEARRKETASKNAKWAAIPKWKRDAYLKTHPDASARDMK